MTTIVQTSEEDPFLSVVRFAAEISWQDAGPEVSEPQVDTLCMEAQDCIVNGRWLDLVSLMLTSADLVFTKVSDKDLECLFTVICNLVTRSASLDEALEMAKLISTKIAQHPTDKPALCLKFLFTLYNLLEDPYSKFYVFKKALDFSIIGKVTDNIIPSLKRIDSFLKEWKIETLDQRSLFLSIIYISKDNKSFSKDSFTFLTKYLATFSKEDAQISDAKPEAVNAIIEFVKTPAMFQCDLLDLPAVQQLENDEKYAPVYQLLDIFLTQRLNAYIDFQAANTSLLKNYGLVHEYCVTKMRLLTLIDLSSGQSGVIPYSVIKDSLQISDDEVEFWVVQAISAKLLDCKMDQMNEIVLVSRYTDRLFGPSQWQVLRSKLGKWRDNISNVVGTIQANKLSEDSPVALPGVVTN
ncbi:Eukaryotic translation initiation factor 3 subunit m [Zostera marina]|uniref:Eukaryotic translation initiation factor 3 subunit M n=1 Tax=Zostera marina TaxID=29655 RepID=A0A0K9PF32_ZOSMR|nr:Eukaryotic translation initiation factor 3 subunit m [Zostera marina]